MKIRGWFLKHKEIVSYLFFGVLTTAVSWLIYFLIMWGGRALFGIHADETSSGRYFVIYTAAQMISWVCAVLFAFYTNRKWVFDQSDASVSVLRQLLVFSSGRLLTLGLDYVITLAGTLLLGMLVPAWNAAAIPFTDKTANICEILAKAAAAVVVIVGNYIFSKLFVFMGKNSGKS